MKKLTLLIIFVFILSGKFIAQNINGLELHFKSKTNKIELYKELWLEAYLINKSSATIKLFKIGFCEDGWNAYEDKWKGTLDGKPLKFSFFSDGPSSKFSLRSFVEVKPGDSIYAGLLRYKIPAAGHYSIVYTLSQDPAKVKMNWAADAQAANKAKEISTYSVTSKPYEFDIEDIKMGEVEVKEITDEELAKKPTIYDLEKAFANPSEVYKLSVRGSINKDVMLKICALKNLKMLTFSRVNGIEELPNELGDLNLIELNLNGIENFKLPAAVTNYKSLKKLSVEEFQITEFPKFIEYLTNLESLTIRNCPITNVSDGIIKLKKLKELALTNVNITRLNPKVSALSSLERLTISKSLVAFPAIFGCKKLKYLSLSYNKQLTQIPDGIGQLKELEEFSLAITGVTTIPKGIAGLKKLKKLLFSNNKITAIPAELYACSALEKIDLSNNKISTVASGINKLVNLREFSAYKNNIPKLPQGLSKCPKIERVWVHTNQIQSDDAEGKVLEQNLGKKYCYKR